MINILIVALYLLAGIVLQKLKALPNNITGLLNTYLIYIVLPVIALQYIPAIELSAELLLPALTVWLFFMVGWILISGIGKFSKWDKATVGCLVLTVGLSNTSFLGFPIIEALYGEEGLKIALLVDQPGSFLLVSSLAIMVAALYGEDKMRKRDIGKKILFFPPFIFFLISLVMNLLNVQVYGIVEDIMVLIAMSLTPIALIAVGLQIKIKRADLIQSPLIIGLAMSLILAPALVYLFLGLILNFEGLIFQVTVMEIAMPPMITASIIAIRFNLKPQLASLMVGVGIPISLISLSIWYLILNTN